MKDVNLIILAALGLLMVACSSENITNEPQPERGEAMIPFVATVGPLGGDGGTRTVYDEQPDGSINVSWKKGDQVAIIHDGIENVVTVSAVANDGTATLSGYLNACTDGAAATLLYPAIAIDASGEGTSGDYSTHYYEKMKHQDGSLAFIAENLDIRSGTAMLSYDGTTARLAGGTIHTTSHIAVWKLNLTSGGNPVNATTVTLKMGNTILAQGVGEAKSEWYLCIDVMAHNQTMSLFKIEASDGTAGMYRFSANQVKLDLGKYYQSTVNLKKDTNLAEVTTDYTAVNGETLTGILGHPVKISIQENAKVTLSNVSITNLKQGDDWAGLTCLGSAELVLEGNNTIQPGLGVNGTGTHEFGYEPAIFIPLGSTLTISGTGKLKANASLCEWSFSAGIGASYREPCGDIVINDGDITAIGGSKGAGIGGATGKGCGIIVINGGTVNATGGFGAAGIGSGSGYNSLCDAIYIRGGKVTAQGGGQGAGIGTGYDNGRCGSIEMSGGTVTATGGEKAPGIGPGYQGTCGSITITDGVTRVTANAGTNAKFSIGTDHSYETGYSNCGFIKMGSVTMGENYGVSGPSSVFPWN